MRLQLFADTLRNDRFVSYGYPASTRAEVGEARLRYDFDRSLGPLSPPTPTAGAGHPLCPCHRQAELQQWRHRHRPPRHLPRAPRPTTSSIRPSTPIRPARSAWAGRTTSPAMSPIGRRCSRSPTWRYDRLHLLVGGGAGTIIMSAAAMTGVLALRAVLQARPLMAGVSTWSASLSWQDASGLTPYLTHAPAPRRRKPARAAKFQPSFWSPAAGFR